ncbi:MIP/aquaporin family protein [Streptomyces flaveolus]|uniref:Aquaporin n=1 Tax=Streptomyces flaveolus TaxID=67297 RepID=A0ABV3AD84_9ACTN
MMSTLRPLPRGLPLARAADEFVLATVMLFLAVTVVRWLRDPGSALYVGNLDTALAVIGVLSGAILTGLILTPPGRRSGGHMNPAVTVSLWLMGVFPGRNVVPYVLAQLAGSAVGTGLGRLAWGRTVSLPPVHYATIVPAPTWQPAAVFLAEAGSMAAIILAVGFVAHPRSARLLPYVIGLSVALVIVFLGPRSGGSINPARQFGPAALAGQTTDLWIYLLAPILGAVLGVWLHRLLQPAPDSGAAGTGDGPRAVVARTRHARRRRGPMVPPSRTGPGRGPRPSTADADQATGAVAGDGAVDELLIDGVTGNRETAGAMRATSQPAVCLQRFIHDSADLGDHLMAICSGVDLKRVKD